MAKEKKPGWIPWQLPLCVLLIALLLSLSVLVQKWEDEKGWKRDLSFNHVTTWSQETQDAIAALPHPVQVYVLSRRGEEDAPLMELLARYAAGSAQIQVSQVDPSLNPDFIRRYRKDEEGITSDAIVVDCEETGRFRVLDATDFVGLGYDMEAGTYQIETLTYETALTTAMVDVTKDEIFRAVLVQGHGELDESGTEMLADLLTRDHYEVVYASLLSSELTLGKNDVVFLLSPVIDLLDAEMDILERFVQDGGSILFTCDYSDPVSDMPYVRSLMRYFGFVPMDGIVIASEMEKDSYYQDNRLFLIPLMYTTEMTGDMVENHETTLILAGSRAFLAGDEQDRDGRTEVVLSTTARAYLRSLSSDLSTLDQLPEDTLGPLALCLTGERMSEQGQLARGVILGCSTVLTSSELYAMTDAQSLILHACRYLSGEETVSVMVPGRSALRPMLTPRRMTLALILLVLIPVSVFATGAVVLVGRQRGKQA